MASEPAAASLVQVWQGRAELDQVRVARIAHQHHDQLVQTDVAGVPLWRGGFRLRQSPLGLGTNVVSGLRAGLYQSLPLQE